jgi:hypothetical protein
MNASVLRWVLPGASAVVVILGVAFAVVSIAGLGLLDQIVAGEADAAEVTGYDDLWQRILGGIVVVGLVEAVLRNRWTTEWLGLGDVERSARRSEAVWRIQRRPPTDQRLLSLSTVFSWIGLAGIGIAIGVSVIGEDATMLRLSYIGKAIGGIGIAASSAAFAALVVRNPEFEPPPATRRPPA